MWRHDLLSGRSPTILSWTSIPLFCRVPGRNLETNRDPTMNAVSCKEMTLILPFQQNTLTYFGNFKCIHVQVQILLWKVNDTAIFFQLLNHLIFFTDPLPIYTPQDVSTFFQLLFWTFSAQYCNSQNIHTQKLFTAKAPLEEKWQSC